MKLLKLFLVLGLFALAESSFAQSVQFTNNTGVAVRVYIYDSGGSEYFDVSAWGTLNHPFATITGAINQVDVNVLSTGCGQTVSSSPATSFTGTTNYSWTTQNCQSGTLFNNITITHIGGTDYDMHVN
jgi:hypothetical protein